MSRHFFSADPFPRGPQGFDVWFWRPRPGKHAAGCGNAIVAVAVERPPERTDFYIFDRPIPTGDGFAREVVRRWPSCRIAHDQAACDAIANEIKNRTGARPHGMGEDVKAELHAIIQSALPTN